MSRADTTLLLVAVGPVQTYIAAARKIRDLAEGSRQLSELSKAVAKSLAESGCDLIFPSFSLGSEELEPASSATVANKILARLPSQHHALDAAAKDCLRKAHEAYRSTLNRQFQIPADYEQEIDWDLFERQKSDYGEFHAVWVHFSSHEAPAAYETARQRADQLLSAKKRTRAFAAPTWDGRHLLKNSLDGARETVLRNHKKLSERGLIKGNEQLDALSLAKRLGGMKAKGFETLSDVALLPWRKGCASMPKGKTLLDAYDREAKAQNLSSSDATQGAFNGRTPPEALRPLLAALVRDFGYASPYAAILLADGDHMGATLNTIGKPEGHKQLSSALAGFAKEARNIVEKHEGSLIYSGGDDVLAFLPLHTALACACALREDFVSRLWKLAEALYPEAPNQAFKKDGIDLAKPGLSAGLAIVHHSEPLYLSLQLAREAEREAKQTYGRNALAIIQSMRSGSRITIGGHWGALPYTRAEPNISSVTDTLAKLIKWIREKGLPSRLCYQLRQLCDELGQDQACANPDTSKIRNYTLFRETRRLLARKAGASSELLSLWEELCAPTYDARALANLLDVAKQLADAQSCAQGLSQTEPDEA